MMFNQAQGLPRARIMNLIKAHRIPTPVLEERCLSSICEDYADGKCENGNCILPHEICRITHTSSLPSLGTPVNVLQMKPRKKALPFETDGPGELSSAGPRHDNDFVNIQSVRILPTTDEILSSRGPFMPKDIFTGLDHLQAGIARHIDLCFRQLRYDNTNVLVDVTHHAIQQLAVEKVNEKYEDYKPQCETPSGAKYLRFRKVAFEEFLFHYADGLVVRLSYECPKDLQGRAIHKAKVLEENRLVALVGMNDIGEVITVFFQIHLRESTEGKFITSKTHERACIQLTFAEKEDTDAVRTVLYYMRGLLKASFVLIDFGSVLLGGFGPHLKQLQNLADWPTVAFESQVVPTNTPTEHVLHPPSYAAKDGFEYDLSVIRSEHVDSSHAGAMKIRPMSNSGVDPHADNVLEMITSCTTLDKGQALSLYESLSRGLAFTQGPPGTGKTFLGVSLIQVILASLKKEHRKPILVICQTNHALDSFLKDMWEKGITNIARVGANTKEEWLRPYDYKELCKKVEKSPYDKHQQWDATQKANSLEADGMSWAESITKEKLGWCVIRDHLRVHHNAEYHQLSQRVGNDNFDFRRGKNFHGFVYEFWSNGGDIENMEELLEAADTLLGSCELKQETNSDKAADFKRKLMAIIKQTATKAKADPIWSLSVSQRHALISQWIKEMDSWKLYDSLAEVHRRHQVGYNRKIASYEGHSVTTLSTVEVIGMTTSGLARYQKMIAAIDPHVAVMEEAGEVLEAHTLMVLGLPSIDHHISIGDPRQLRPHTKEMPLSSEHSEYGYDKSLFERLENQVPSSQLTVQRRMHPDIADLSRVTLYPSLEDHESTGLRAPVANIADRMYFLDHCHPEERPDPSSPMAKSYHNNWEVEMICRFVDYLIRVGGYTMGQMAIITPYNGQLAALTVSLQKSCDVWLSQHDREALRDKGLLPTETLKKFGKTTVNLSSLLRVATVDNFQGEEADIVIFSAVRSNDDGKLGFLEIANRVNVACSRARNGFYIFGNAQLLSRFPMWEKIINVFREKRKIGKAIRACCSAHPDTIFEVKEAIQFSQVPPCRYLCLGELECGHVCKNVCHPSSEHGIMPCTEKCERLHPCGHECSEICGIPCGECAVKLSSIVLNCGHISHHTCDELASGRKPKCKFAMEKVYLSCGHVKEVFCSCPDDSLICELPCGAKLPCGHSCASKCTDCQASSEHPSCQNTCSRELKCGHECKAGCGHKDDCPPCQAPCQRSCEHGKCENVCSFICDPCVKVSTSQCEQHGTSQSICCLPSCSKCVTQTASAQSLALADQMVKLPDTLDRLYVQSGRKLNDFTKEIESLEGALFHTFSNFCKELENDSGPLSCKRDHEKVRERGTHLEGIQSQIAQFRDEVVIPVQDALASIANTKVFPMVVLPFKSRFDSLYLRCRLIALDEGLRAVLYMQQQQDKREEPVEHITVIITALKLNIATESINNIVNITSKITECEVSNLKRLEVEFRLLQIQFYMIAKSFDITEEFVELNVVASLKRIADLCKMFPNTAAIFLKLGSDLRKHYQGDSAPDRYREWNTNQVKELSKIWGEHEVGHMKSCKYQHPYSSKVFGDCPECGKEINISLPLPKSHINYDNFLSTDAKAIAVAMNAMQRKNYGSPKHRR